MTHSVGHLEPLSREALRAPSIAILKQVRGWKTIAIAVVKETLEMTTRMDSSTFAASLSSTPPRVAISPSSLPYFIPPRKLLLSSKCALCIKIDGLSLQRELMERDQEVAGVVDVMLELRG